MAHYRRKVSLVEARQHDMDTSINVNSCLMGMQTARKGDFLVVDHVNLVKLREQEKAEGLPENSLPDVGTIYVVSKKDFLEDFEEVGVETSKPEADVEPNHFDSQAGVDAYVASYDGPEGILHYTIGDDPTVISIDVPAAK